MEDTGNDEEYAFDEFDEDSVVLSPVKKTVKVDTIPEVVTYEVPVDDEYLDALMTNTAGLRHDDYGDGEFAESVDSPGGGTAEAVRAALTSGVMPAEISSKYDRFFSFDAEDESTDNKGSGGRPQNDNSQRSESPHNDYHSNDDSHVLFVDNNFDNYGNNGDDREGEDEVFHNVKKDIKDTVPDANVGDDYEKEFYEMELAPAVDRKSSLKKNSSSPTPVAATAIEETLEVSVEDTRSGESGGEIDLSYINSLLANNQKILENAAVHTSSGNNDTVPNGPTSSSSVSPSPRGPTSSGGGPGYFNVLDVLSSEKIPTTNLNNTNTKKFVKVEEVHTKDISSLSFNVDSTGNTISIVSASPAKMDVSRKSVSAVTATAEESSNSGAGGVDVKRLSILKSKVTKVRGTSMSSDTSTGDRNSREREELVQSSGHGNKRRGNSDSEPSNETAAGAAAPPAPASVLVSPLSSRKRSSNPSENAALAAANKKKAAAVAAAKAAAQEEYDELMALVENPAAAAAAAASSATGIGSDEASISSQNSKASNNKGRGTVRGTVVRGTIARVNSNASAGSSSSAASNAAALSALSDIQQKHALLPMQIPNKGISNGGTSNSSSSSNNRASIRKTVIPPVRHVKKANVGVTPLINIIQKKPVPSAAAAQAAKKKPRRAGVSMPDDQVYEEDFNALEEGEEEGAIVTAPAPTAAAPSAAGSERHREEGQAGNTSSSSPKKARSSVRFTSDSSTASASGLVEPLDVQSIVSTNALMVEGLVTPPRELTEVVETSRSVPNKTHHAVAAGAAAPHAKVRGASVRLYNPVPPAGNSNTALNRASHRVAGSIRKVVPPKGPTSEDRLSLASSNNTSAAGGIAATAGTAAAPDSVAGGIDSQSELSPSTKKLHDPYARVKGTMHTQPLKVRPSVAVNFTAAAHPVGGEAVHVEDQHKHHDLVAEPAAQNPKKQQQQPADPYAKVQGTMHTQPAKGGVASVRAGIAVTHHQSHPEQKPHDPYANVQGTMHTQPVKTSRQSVIKQQHNPQGHAAKNHDSQSTADFEEEMVEEELEEVAETNTARRQQEKALDCLVRGGDGEEEEEEADHPAAVDEYEGETDFVEESLESFEEASPSTHTINNNSNGVQQHQSYSQRQKNQEHHSLEESSAGVSTVSGQSQSHYVTRLHQHVSVAGRMRNHIYPRANKDPYQMYDESSGLFSSFEVEYQRASRMEQYRIDKAEKERQKQIEIETARYSYMKRNQELLVEKHFREMKLIRDNAQREERVEALRAQHIVAYEKIHNELEEIRLRMENLTNLQGKYKNNYIRMAGNIIPPAPKTKTYQPAEPVRRIKYKNPVAMGPVHGTTAAAAANGGSGVVGGNSSGAAPRHFEQVTVQRQQQQPHPPQQMKPTAPSHSKPAYGSSFNKKGKIIKQMPPANAPRKMVHVHPTAPPAAAAAVVHVNEFGDLTADASDLHSNPSNIVISEFYDEDFNPEEGTSEVEEALNGVLLQASSQHNQSGNDSYHSLHSTNYSSLPVELVSVHSPINNVVKVTKTTLVIDVDRMAEEGADVDTPVAALGASAAQAGSLGKISRDSSAGYHLYYEPDDDEEALEEVGESLSPARQRDAPADAALDASSVAEESITDSNALEFMSDLVDAVGRKAGAAATFKSSQEYEDEGFEEEEEDSEHQPHVHSHDYGRSHNSQHSSVGFYSMEFEGEEEEGEPPGSHSHTGGSGGGGSGVKPKRKGTPMRRARPVDLENDEDEDEDEVEVESQQAAATGPQKNLQRDQKKEEQQQQQQEEEEGEGEGGGYEEDYHEPYLEGDGFEQDEGEVGGGAGEPGVLTNYDFSSVNNSNGNATATKGLMAGSISSLDYSGDFSHTLAASSGFLPFSASSSQVLEGSSGSQVDALFPQLDGESLTSTSGAGGPGRAPEKAAAAASLPKYEGIASDRLNSMYMSQNEDFNGEEMPFDKNNEDDDGRAVTSDKVNTAEKNVHEVEEDHYQDDEFETSELLPSNSGTGALKQTTYDHLEKSDEEAVHQGVEEEDEYADDFNTTQTLNATSTTVGAAAAATEGQVVSGAYDEEDEELLLMLTSSAPPAKGRKAAVEEEEEDPYGDEEFH